MCRSVFKVLSFPYMLMQLYLQFKMQCANAIDHLATFYFEHILMAESPASPALLSCAQHISDCGDIFLDVSFLSQFSFSIL